MQLIKDVAFIVALLVALFLVLVSIANAEELSIPEKHEVELMIRKQQDLNDAAQKLQAEWKEVEMRLRKAHGMKPSDSWDASGNIVRKPVETPKHDPQPLGPPGPPVLSSPKPKAEPAKK